MLSRTIREKIDRAVLDKDEITRDILRVALGEIQTIEARKGTVTDEEATKVLQKLVDSNRETIRALRARHSDDADTKASRLEAEVDVLKPLLPNTLSQEDIRNRLVAVSDQIAKAKGDGQAIGLAMKYLKGAGEQVSGDDVKTVVQEMRTASTV